MREMFRNRKTDVAHCDERIEQRGIHLFQFIFSANILSKEQPDPNTTGLKENT